MAIGKVALDYKVRELIASVRIMSVDDNTRELCDLFEKQAIELYRVRGLLSQFPFFT